MHGVWQWTVCSAVSRINPYTPLAESTPVDLGLPSGLKWAAGNIGAKNPQEYGLYFAWGETTGYTAEQVTSGVRSFDAASYTAPEASVIAPTLTLKLEYDAARANLGGNWRMPTDNECEELIDNCDAVWTDDYNGTGVAGCIFTSKINGNSVFFPAAGYFNGSSVKGVGSSGRNWSALGLGYKSSHVSYLYLVDWKQGVNSYPSFYGLPVRGVCE